MMLWSTGAGAQSNDHFFNAIVLPSQEGFCSGEGQYNNLGATPDKNRPSGWPSGPYSNVWYKFQATSNSVKVDLKVGGSEGTLRNGMLSLWEEGSNYAITSSSYTTPDSDVSLSFDGLLVGQWYYVGVDSEGGAPYQGSFTLCLGQSNDHFFNAIVLPSQEGFCSGEGQYNNLGATPDKNRPSGWPSGPYSNVWYKFQATSNSVKVDLKVGGSEGTLRNGMLSLWEEGSSNAITGRSYTAPDSDVSLSFDGLLVGQWYYVGVDNDGGPPNQGSFTLCLDQSNDNFFNAIVLPSQEGFCSGEGQYTNLGATPDKNRPPGWPGGPYSNVWYKFQATSNSVKVDLKVGGSEGTLRNGMLSLWEEGSSNAITSRSYTAPDSDVSLSFDGLVVGQWYYVGVDNDGGPPNQGSFTLCLDQSNDNFFNAIVLPSQEGFCSGEGQYNNLGATPDKNRPPGWPGGPYSNVWYKFQATSNSVKVDLKVGGSEGTLRNGMLSLWGEGSNYAITGSSYTAPDSDISLSFDDLVVGQWYYVGVDNDGGAPNQGSFTLCLENGNISSNDSKQGAPEINLVNGSYCSELSEFNSMNASPDGPRPSSWQTGPNKNVWFKFQASESAVRIDLKTSGSEGTLTYGMLALYNANDVELKSAGYGSSSSDRTINHEGLVIGDWYYVSVDDRYGSGGTFTLCVDSYPVTFDSKLGAQQISSNGYCSALQEFTNASATPDGSRPSSWQTGPNKNVWFKFQASESAVRIDLKTSGSEGTLTYGMLALYDANDVELKSAGYGSSSSDRTINHEGLVIGDWYYVSVDDRYGSGGTFTLCVDSYPATFDSKLGAQQIPSNGYCSALQEFTNASATPDDSRPSSWQEGPNRNVWFKFQATEWAVKIDMKTSDSEGTLRYGMLALYDASQVEIESVGYGSSSSDRSIEYEGLTIGDWYYISVDTRSSSSYSGTFTLCVDNYPATFDDWVGAMELPVTEGYCSSLQEFTTSNATPDGSRPSSWQEGPNRNVWFKFQATEWAVKIDLKTSDPEGTLRYGMLALYDASQVEIESIGYGSSSSDRSIEYEGLTIGDWYYISVDTRSSSSYSGTFTLCVDNYPATFDDWVGAMELPFTEGYCSSLQEFTTSNATPDGSRPSSWQEGPNRNVWFKFQATEWAVKIDMKTSDSEGTLRYGMLALYDANQLEIASTGYGSSSSDRSIDFQGLTVGDWYYISVDTRSSSSYSGSFTLCVDNYENFDFWQSAKVLSDAWPYCSGLQEFTNAGASADGSKPSTWSTGPTKNVWFKFQALSETVNIVLKTYAEEGTIKYPMLALFDNQKNELASKSYGNSQTDDIGLGYSILAIGAWYYIAVDSRYASESGSFTLCLDQSYDEMANARELTDQNFCNVNQVFSNIGATPDGPITPSGFPEPNHNVWFKFQATSKAMRIRRMLDENGQEVGTLNSMKMVLFDLGAQELTNVMGPHNSLVYNNFTIGQWYYLSVDGDEGTFSLCMENYQVFDEKSEALVVDSLDNHCFVQNSFMCVGASFDGFRPDNWGVSVDRNVWFKFQATEGGISINLTPDVDDGVSSFYLALTDDQNNDLISTGVNVDNIRYTNLIIGSWYYLNVGVSNSENEGFFGLCFDTFESNDLKENAYVLEDVDDYRSGNGEFHNAFATQDGGAVPWWPSGHPKQNVWFKFQAVARGVKIELRTGGEFGTLEYPMLALDGIQGLSAGGRYDSRVIYHTNLTVGEWYYINVDNNDSQTGSFTLHVDNSSAYDYQTLAFEIPDVSAGYCSPEGSFATNQVVIAGAPVNSWLGNRSHYQWFKFQGTDHNSIALSLESETLTSSRFYFLDEEGQVLTSNTESSLSSKTLTYYNAMNAGDWYYVLVANGSPNVEPFTLCISPFSYNDTPETAQIITNLDGSFSQPFTTAGGTPDGIKPDEWSTGPHHNVWFKFQADDLGARIKLVYADNTSDLTHAGMLALWDSQLQVKQALGSGLGYDKRIYDLSLQPGEWYYVSVDQEDPNGGDFVLSITSRNVADNRADAVDITTFILSQEGYPSPPPPDFWPQNNKGATPDGIKPKKWVEEPFKNIWFKFQATHNAISITVDELSNLEMPMIALYEAGGGELASQRSLTSSPIVNITWNDLIVGDWYEITVDGEDFDGGRFTLDLEGYSSNNSFEYPFIIEDPENYSSSDEPAINDRYFTTADCTYDGNFPASWEGDPNVWFSFQAVGNSVMVKVSDLDADNAKLALLDSVGIILTLKESSGNGTIIYFSGLDVGGLYYVSVSSDQASSRNGDFRLEIENSDKSWSMQTATELTIIDTYASANKEFNNLNVPNLDGSGFPGENRVWFKFQAVENGVTLEAETYSSQGDARELGIGLTNGSGELLKYAYNNYNQRNKDIAISYGQLEVDSTYFFYVESDDPGTFSLKASTFVSNDNMEDAFVLNDSTCVDMEVSAVSIDGPIPPYWGSGRPNVWFKFWASDEAVRLTCDNHSMALHDSLGNVLTTAVGELAYFDLVPGQLYYLNAGIRLPCSITVCMESLPYNDSPAEAYDITYLESESDLLTQYLDKRWLFDSEDATPDLGKPVNWQEGPVQNTWFKMVVPYNLLNVSIDTRELANPLEYGMLALYNDQLEELTSVGYDPDNANNGALEYVGLTAGATYYLSVDHRAGAEYSGRFSLIWSSCNQSPGFVAGSIAYSGGGICVGEPFVINSSQPASGSIGAMRYRWQKSTVSEESGFTNLSERSTELSMTAGVSQTTWFRRRAEPLAECADKYSNVVSVTVLGGEGAEITDPEEICYGETDIPPFEVSATVGAIDHYEWEVSTLSEESGFEIIPGSNSQTITPDLGDEFHEKVWYRRKTYFSNGCTQYSNTIVLVVNRLLAGQIDVGSGYVCSGQSFTLSSTEGASHSSIGPINAIYSWEKSTSSAISGFESISGSGVSKSVSSQAESTAWYRRVASFNGCEVVTQAVQLNVIAPPQAEAVQQSLVFFGAQEVTLSVVNLGYDYEWYETEEAGTAVFTGSEYTYQATSSKVFFVQTVDPVYPSCPTPLRTAIEVKVFPLPVIESTANVIYDETGVDLQANYMDYETFSWSFNGREIGSDPTITVFQPGSYTLTVSTHGLSRSTSIDISSERVLWAVRDGDWNDVNIWSFSKESLPPVTLLPGSGDVVMIDGQLVAVSGSETCKEIYLSNSTGETELVVMSTGSLTVHGDVKISKSASNPNADVNFRVEGNGLVECVPME